VADQRVAVLRELLDVAHARDQLVTECRPDAGDRRPDERVVGRVVDVAGPPFTVAADPDRVLQRAQALDALAWPAAEQRVVAAEDPAARALRLGVREHGLQRGQVSEDVVQAGEHPWRVYHRATLAITGPTLTLRYATADDAPRLLELAGDPAVTQWFSWGPYTSLDQPEAYIAGLEAKRETGELLDFLVVHEQHGPIGVTGLSELSARNRHATVGSWFGREFWGSGANRESKALLSALAFRELGMDRLTAWANTRNGRSQRALERIGFRREGVLNAWHRHGDHVHDVVIFGMVRAAWERSPLHDVPVTVEGTPPPAFVVG
jgi:ribosomal-protein-alanine N-acetyltransferase